MCTLPYRRLVHQASRGNYRGAVLTNHRNFADFGTNGPACPLQTQVLQPKGLPLPQAR